MVSSCRARQHWLLTAIGLLADPSAAPIMEGIVGDDQGLLAHTPGIALQQRSEEEELALRHGVLLDDQDGARSFSLPGCKSSVIMH